MPHKHKRSQKDEATYDLPPSVIAKPLPVREQQAKEKEKQKQKQKQQTETKKETAASSHSRRKDAFEDDTPKAFRRLMQFQTRGRRAPSAQETEDKISERNNNKKRKRDATARKDESNKKPAPTKPSSSSLEGPQQQQQQQGEALPKILPGEKLSDFAARVDRALPLSGMTKSTKPGQGKIREDRQTRHEKHLRRLQRGWREEEARIREREEAEREEREDEMEDQLRLWKEWKAEAATGKAKKKAAAAAKKKKNKGKNRAGAGVDDPDGQHSDAGGDDDNDDPDPWAELKKRDRARQANPFEVVQAPPQLTKPREIFKVRGGARVDVANVPAAVGSLRRREELAGERRNIVEEYRRLMAEKRQ